MYTDVNVATFEFDRGSVWPHFELIQLGSRHILQRTDPLSWNQEAGIAVCDDLDGVPLGNLANGLRPNLGLCLSSAGSKRRCVLAVADLLRVHGRNLTSSVAPSLKTT